MGVDPLVSIIIPLYNAEKYVDLTIQTAINQTWKNKEIIIIDDGSRDNSYNIALKYKTHNIFVLKQENRGASTARNRGLSLAKGDYIQFLDADDLLSSNKIEEQFKILKDYPDYLGLCPTVYFIDGEDPYKVHPAHEWYAEGTKNTTDFLIKLYGGSIVGANYGGMIQPNAWLIPRSIIDKAGLWDENLSVDDDGEYFCRVVLRAAGICYAPNATNYYRLHVKNNNLSAQLTLKGFESMLNATDLKYEHLKDKVDTSLLNKIFSLHYQQIATAAYPIFKAISSQAVNKAKSLGFTKIKYFGGPFSLFLGKFLGWKIVRLINYWRFK